MEAVYVLGDLLRDVDDAQVAQQADDHVLGRDVHV